MQSDKRPILIGITGGVGSGKSTFCRLLSNHGYVVYSADIIAHEAYRHPEIIATLLEIFGQKVIIDGTLDRKLIGKLVFSDRDLRNRLNSILHPHILNRMQELYDRCESRYCFFEVPLLIEADLIPCFDFTVLVYCTVEQQIKHLVNTRGLEKEDAKKIIAAQMDIETKRDRLDYIVENTGNIPSLVKEVDRFIEQIASIPHRRIKKLNRKQA
jgi:dephospho-CoA kinase